MRLNDESTHYNKMYTDESYPLETAGSCFLQAHYVKCIQSLLKQNSNAEVLSLGSGNGYSEFLMAPYVKSITAIELSEIAVQKAQRRVDENGIRNMEFIQGDGRAFQKMLPKRKFDLILALGFLHHLSDEDIQVMIASAKQVLKPGGYFISMDPNQYRAVGLFKLFVSSLIRRYHSSYERELVPQEIRHCFLMQQYQSVVIRYVDYFLNPFIWIFPKLPVVLIKALLPLDRCLTKLTIINRYSNLFVCIAQK